MSTFTVDFPFIVVLVQVCLLPLRPNSFPAAEEKKKEKFDIITNIIILSYLFVFIDMNLLQRYDKIIKPQRLGRSLLYVHCLSFLA